MATKKQNDVQSNIEMIGNDHSTLIKTIKNTKLLIKNILIIF
jgi:hypothetical protein